MTVFDNHLRRASRPATCAAGPPLPRCRFFPSPRIGSGPRRAQPNRYTDLLNTASAERRHSFSLGTLEDLVSGYYAQAAKLVADTDNNAALALYLTKADPIQVLRDLLGHSSVLTTQVYLSRIDLNRVFREVYEDVGRQTGLSGAVLAEVDDELADEPVEAR